MSVFKKIHSSNLTLVEGGAAAWQGWSRGRKDPCETPGSWDKHRAISQCCLLKEWFIVFIFPHPPNHFCRSTCTRRQVAQGEVGYKPGMPWWGVFRCHSLAAAPAGLVAGLGFCSRISRCAALRMSVWGLKAGSASCRPCLTNTTFFFLICDVQCLLGKTSLYLKWEWIKSAYPNSVFLPYSSYSFFICIDFLPLLICAIHLYIVLSFSHGLTQGYLSALSCFQKASSPFFSF